MQKDNSTKKEKAALRVYGLTFLDEPQVLESNAGYGVMFLKVYSQLKSGVAFEKDEDKIRDLCVQRPTWACYKGDSISLLKNGVGFDFSPNFFDVDPYGSCWPYIEAIFENRSRLGSRTVLAVNCGLRKKMNLSGSWNAKGFEELTEKYGSRSGAENYLSFCHERLLSILKGEFILTTWHGYYCGAGKGMTHFLAVLDRKG